MLIASLSGRSVKSCSKTKTTRKLIFLYYKQYLPVFGPTTLSKSNVVSKAAFDPTRICIFLLTGRHESNKGQVVKTRRSSENSDVSPHSNRLDRWTCDMLLLIFSVSFLFCKYMCSIKCVWFRVVIGSNNWCILLPPRSIYRSCSSDVHSDRTVSAAAFIRSGQMSRRGGSAFPVHNVDQRQEDL